MRHYQDRLYGDFPLSEKVVLEVLASAAMRRLQGVEQAGYFEPFFPGSKHSRFEHSVGVYLLLRKAGASLEECLAGLIHDVSHQVFSHCIDYVFDADGRTQAFQDQQHVQCLLKSDLPAIFERHGFDLTRLLDDSLFPLKERPLPELCADRIDYSLRTALYCAPRDERLASFDLPSLLSKLKIHQAIWGFEDVESARAFAELFSYLNRRYYSGPQSAVMFAAVSDCLKHALKKGYVMPEDFWLTDQHVLDKLRLALPKDTTLLKLYKRMSNQTPYKIGEGGIEIWCKSRMVDPLFFHAGLPKRLSDSDPVFAARVREELVPKSYWISFEE